jgi:hypothetical protein
MPFAKVEVATPFTSSRDVWTAPTNVEVASDVASKSDADEVPNTESFAYGDVVPTPTFPLLSTMKFVFVDEPTTNCGAVPFVTSEFTESRAHGVDVPIPTNFDEFTRRPVPPTVRSDEKRFVELAFVAKKFVVVADVPVAFAKVKF